MPEENTLTARVCENLGFVMTVTFNYEPPLFKVSIYKTGKQYDYKIKAKLVPKCFYCKIIPLLLKKKANN